MKTKGSLKSAFRTASVPARDMRVMKDHHDPVTGARLICVEIPSLYAEKTGVASGRIFLTGWVPGGSTRIHDGTICRSESEAKRQFNLLKDTARPPRTKIFDRDWQRQRVYDWEAKMTEYRSMKLTIEQMAHLISQISQDFNIKPPKFRYVKPDPSAETYYNYYISATHTVEMRDKTLSVLVHEMAHALDFMINKNTTNVHHGPSFMRTLITLAKRYQWLDTKALEESLKKAGVRIADLDDLPELKARLEYLNSHAAKFAQTKVIPILK